MSSLFSRKNTFDKNGRRIKDVYESYNGNIYSSVKYSYSKIGKVLSKTEHNSENKFVYKDSFIYNEQGLLTEKINIDYSNNKHTYKYHYNNLGLLDSFYNYSHDSNYIDLEVFNYSHSGLLLEWNLFSDNKLVSEVK